MGLKDIGQKGVNLTDLTQDRHTWGALVKSVTDLRVPLQT